MHRRTTTTLWYSIRYNNAQQLRGWTAETGNDIDESQTYCWLKKARHQGVNFMIPFMWSSRTTDKSMDRGQNIAYSGRRWALTKKRHKGASWGAANVLYIDLGGGCVGEHTYVKLHWAAHLGSVCFMDVCYTSIIKTFTNKARSYKCYLVRASCGED